jgi:competence protein ComEA
VSGIPLARSHAVLVAVAAVVALALVGRRLADAGGTARGAEPAQARLAQLKPAAPIRLVVHVAGAVRRPGVYRFRDGARVADAVARAGGSTRNADLSALNLAAPLSDGVQVLVPAVAPLEQGGVPSAEQPGGTALVGGKVHLSAASAEELDELPGIGPVTAQKIVDWRTKHGPFRTLEDLDAIPGIGPARIQQLRDQVVP